MACRRILTRRYHDCMFASGSQSLHCRVHPKDRMQALAQGGKLPSSNIDGKDVNELKSCDSHRGKNSWSLTNSHNHYVYLCNLQRSTISRALPVAILNCLGSREPCISQCPCCLPWRLQVETKAVRAGAVHIAKFQRVLGGFSPFRTRKLGQHQHVRP